MLDLWIKSYWIHNQSFHVAWNEAVGSEEIVDAWSGQGDTVGWIGVDMVAVGVFGAADQLRKEAVEAVRNLKVWSVYVQKFHNSIWGS